MSLYFALLTVENNKNKKSLKFQGNVLIFCDFIQVYVFTTNHHLNNEKILKFLSEFVWVIDKGMQRKVIQ